jgi:hypothetical protein
MRRNAANNSEYLGKVDVDDVSSDEEADHDIDNDLDSDDMEEPEEFFGSRTHELSQQQDFIGLS